MILRLLHAGSAGKGGLAEAAEDYRRRLGRHLKTDEVFVRPERSRGSSAADIDRALVAEGARLLARVDPRTTLVALDRQGQQVSSSGLARRLDAWLASGATAIALTLGSAHGLDRAVLDRAQWVWSFGPLTYPHDLARVVLWEQLYRAGTISRGEPYHK